MKCLYLSPPFYAAIRIRALLVCEELQAVLDLWNMSRSRQYTQIKPTASNLYSRDATDLPVEMLIDTQCFDRFLKRKKPAKFLLSGRLLRL